MRDLSLVGLSEDRHYVVLRSPSGEEFRVPADDRLRAALKGDRARLGQLEIQMDSALRPRDIQARIRRGESAETVAEAAQVPVERIMAYAVPVLAEREHICERARSATVRRPHVSAPASPFGDVIGAEFRDRDIDATSVEWDSWRREDARWVVSVRVPDDDGPALYLFDAPGRYVVAENERARELIGDVADDSDMALAAAVTDEVGEGVPGGVPAPPGARPTDVPTEDVPAPEEEHDEVEEFGVTSLKRARARRALAQEQLLFEGEATEERDAEGAGVSPEAEGEEPTAEPEQEADAKATTVDLTDAATAVRAAGESTPTTPTAPPPSEQPETPPKKSRRRERRRVPSWDEIMFGNKPEE